MWHSAKDKILTLFLKPAETELLKMKLEYLMATGQIINSNKINALVGCTSVTMFPQTTANYLRYYMSVYQCLGV
jgi:hypothetical protein